jgi:hypothetical protein
MQPDNDHVVTGKDDQAASRAVGSYPLWKRGFATFWVLLLCAISGLFGLFVAGFFTSFSGY